MEESRPQELDKLSIEADIEEADKLCKNTLFRKLFGHSNEKLEEASHMYSKIAMKYKLKKDFKNALSMYLKSKDCLEKITDGSVFTSDIDECLINAVDCNLKLGNIDDALELIYQICDDISDKNKSKLYASYKKIALQIIQENKNIDKGIVLLEKSIAFFELHDYSSDFIECCKIIGRINANNNNYLEAIEYFERIVNYCTGINNLKYQSYNYLTDAMLCHIASGDIVSAEYNLNKYINIDYSFSAKREFGLINDIITCYKEANTTQFTVAVKNYDDIQKLDPWRVSLLLTIKKSITETFDKGNEFDIT